MGGGRPLFLSTPSARRATGISALTLPAAKNFYPRPPRGGRRGLAFAASRSCPISIHALREEGDDPVADSNILRIDFYPRPPRGGRRFAHPAHKHGFEFLSTPSARRATRSDPFRLRAAHDFYPRPPRGGRRHWRALFLFERNFYPRPPRGGRRGQRSASPRRSGISIHALREEGDL